METVKDLLTSFFESLRDRVGNPLVGAFVVSWLIWNFRLVLVFVGDGDGGWRSKLDFIDRHLMVHENDWWLHGVFFPLLFACLWVFVFPFLFRYILIFDKTQRFATKRAILKAEEKKPISDQEAMRLHLRMKDMSESWEEERMLYLRTIEALQDKVKSVPNSSSVSGIEIQGATPDKARTAKESVTAESTDIVPAGLQLVDSSSSDGNSRGYVDFKGVPIVWPWAINTDEQTELPSSIHANLKNAVLSEEALIVLYFVRDADSFTLGTVAKRLALELFDVRVAVDELSALGMIHGPFGKGTEFAITSSGRMTLAWLLRKGFRFHTDGEPI